MLNCCSLCLNIFQECENTVSTLSQNLKLFLLELVFIFIIRAPSRDGNFQVFLHEATAVDIRGGSDPPFEIQTNVSKSNYDYNKHQRLISIINFTMISIFNMVLLSQY